MDCEGDDDDLAADMTRLVNRLRALLHTLHPALERALVGGAITSQAACGPLAEYGGPHGLRRVGRDLATQWARANLRAVGRMDERLFDALGEQDAAPAWDGDDTDDIIRDLARRIRETGPRRARIERRMHEIASADEEYRLARTMPGMGGCAPRSPSSWPRTACTGSPTRPASPRTPAWPRPDGSPEPASATTPPRARATASSNAPSTSRPASPSSTTPTHAPTTNASGTRASTTRRR